MSHMFIDLLRPVARPVGEDDHLILGQVGDGIHRRANSRHEARDGAERRRQNHDGSVSNRTLYQPVDHGRVTFRKEFISQGACSVNHSPAHQFRGYTSRGQK